MNAEEHFRSEWFTLEEPSVYFMGDRFNLIDHGKPNGKPCISLVNAKVEWLLIEDGKICANGKREDLYPKVLQWCRDFEEG